jgi:hypothetical protein
VAAGERITPADVQKALEKSARFIKAIGDMSSELTYQATKRLNVSSALFQISLEHFAAIRKLIDSSIIGSASALLRPQYEAYIRATWMARCATDDQFDSFCGGRQPPRIDKLIEQIEEAGIYERGVLQSYHDERWDHFCDLTHGGAMQAASRIGDSGIRPIADIEIALQILQSSAVIAGIACIDMPESVGAFEVANTMYLVYERIYGPKPSTPPPPLLNSTNSA